jgi:hypothetical protein
MSFEQAPTTHVEETKKESGSESRDLTYLEGMVHPLLEKYPASYLAKGGEHFVFEVEKADAPERMRDVVIKASIKHTRWLERYGADTPENLERLPDGIQKKMKELIRIDRKKYMTFTSYFGRKNVSPQRKFLMKVPMSEATTKIVFGKSEMAPKEAWTVVTVQKRAKELEPEYEEKRFDLGATYVEMRENIDTDAYAEVSARLFSGDPESKQEKAEDLSFIDERTQDLLNFAVREPSLKEALIDFVQKAIAYTEDTKEILDLVGNDNVFFVYDKMPDGSRKWRYKIVDGYSAREISQLVVEAEKAVSKFVTKREMDGSGAADYMNVANYARTINAMAGHLGIPERLHLLEGLSKRTYGRMMKEVQNKIQASSRKKAA